MKLAAVQHWAHFLWSDEKDQDQKSKIPQRRERTEAKIGSNSWLMKTWCSPREAWLHIRQITSHSAVGCYISRLYQLKFDLDRSTVSWTPMWTWLCFPHDIQIKRKLLGNIPAETGKWNPSRNPSRLQNNSTCANAHKWALCHCNSFVNNEVKLWSSTCRTHSSGSSAETCRYFTISLQSYIFKSYIIFVKEQFPPKKCKFSHHLLNFMLMESWEKFHRPQNISETEKTTQMLHTARPE